MVKLLLALLAIAVVAPASASQLPSGTRHYPSPCAYHRAQLAAAGYEPIAPTEAIDASWFDAGRGSSFLRP